MSKKAKAELTPEQLEAKRVKKQRKSNRWTKFWAIVLALVLVGGVAFGAKTMADKAKVTTEEATNAADPGANTNTNTNTTPAANTNTNTNTSSNTSSNTSTNTNTTPATTAPSSSSSSNTPATPSNDEQTTAAPSNDEQPTEAPADNNNNQEQPADDNNGGNEEPQPAANPVDTINAAMAAAANAGYTWTRTGNLTELNVPSKDTLDGIINKVSEGSTVETVVGGFLGAKGNAETLVVQPGVTPMNDEGTDTYYHWDHYKIIPTSLQEGDLQNLQVNGNEYSFTLAACTNPSPGSDGFSRFTNDYVTLDQVNTEIKANVSVVSVSDMTAVFGPMNVVMTIEDGYITQLQL